MRLAIDDPDFRLYVGDVREVLVELPPESVHCVVTSPPYWALRDYGTGVWEGGDLDCDHLQDNPSALGGDRETATNQARRTPYGDLCGKCGARRIDRQLGLEATPEAYVAAMVEVFRELRRVLRRDGTFWLNIGDCYSGVGAQYGGTSSFQKAAPMMGKGTYRRGLKPKDLVGVPWMLAFALRADGWYLRSEVIWSKPNPMPESIRDRPTKSHEQVFLLTRSQRYFYDIDAIREPASGIARPLAIYNNGATRERNVYEADGLLGRNARSVWEIATQPYSEAHFATFPQELARRCIAAGCPLGGTVLDPFIGSGTTAHVARKLGRLCIGIDLNEAYATIAASRTQQLSLFAEVVAL